jgi:hypothetical protein
MNHQRSLLLFLLIHYISFTAVFAQSKTTINYIRLSGEEYELLLKQNFGFNGNYYIEYPSTKGGYSETPFIIDNYVYNKRNGEYKVGVIRKLNNKVIDTLYSTIANYKEGVKNGYSYYSQEDLLEGNYKDGMKEGIWKEEYGNNPGVTSFFSYKKGVRNGLCREIIYKTEGLYDQDELHVGHYKRNKKNGDWYSLNINDTIFEKYKNGCKNGTFYSELHPSGISTGFTKGTNYKNRRHGKIRSYNYLGELVTVRLVNYGEVIKTITFPVLDIDTICWNKEVVYNVPEYDYETKLNFDKARSNIELFRSKIHGREKVFVQHYNQFTSLQSSGYLKDGLKYGKWIYKNTECNVDGFIYYKNGERNGKYHFSCSQYRVEGKLKSGMKKGKWYYYNSEGTLERVEQFN